jgi:hypothetical protein
MAELYECMIPGCTRTCKSYKWAKIRASQAGWFFSRSGKAVCPAHSPKKVR